jgi:glucose-1-phosphate thymidylyltransferase
VKGLVLAGGVGSRLRPLSHTIAKQLIPVAGKPVLFHCLEALREAGITEVGIVVGDRADEIQRATGDGEAFGLSIEYLPQAAPLGLAHCVRIARDFLGDDDFVMYLGDNVVHHRLGDFVEQFARRRPAAQLLVSPVDEPQHYGIAEVASDDQVVELAEKPLVPKSNLAVVGVYLFSAAIHRAVDEIIPSHRGELEITDAIQWLVGHGEPVFAQRLTGLWRDTGRVDDLLDCNRIMLTRRFESAHPEVLGKLDAHSRVDGDVHIEQGARVSRSRIVGPALILAGTRITDSYVGPFTSIGADCVVERSAIESSIVMDAAVISDVGGLRDSVIGREAQVGPASGPAPGHRLVIGDHSSVALQSR